MFLLQDGFPGLRGDDGLPGPEGIKGVYGEPGRRGINGFAGIPGNFFLEFLTNFWLNTIRESKYQ